MPDATRVTWTRGGSSPEVEQVTFELSTDGQTSYALLPGTPTRAGSTSNWQLTGLNLPASGHFRARGRTSGGSGNGSGSAVESLWTFGGALTAPRVTGISPVRGFAPGGTSVTITGTGFATATGVTIGGAPATSFTIVSDTIITATAPAGPAGPASVLVTGPGGTNAANTLFAFVAPPTAALSTTNLLSIATTYTLSGSGFDAVAGNNSVVFTPAGSGLITTASGTSLTVTNLTGLTPGPLYAVVTTNGQSSVPVQVATVVLPGIGDPLPFNANITGFTGSNAVVNASAVQPDGKMIIAGKFNSVLGVTRYNMARLNADGTLDMGFNPNVDNVVRCVALQTDGRILLGGDFSGVSAIGRPHLARVNADGSLDLGFNANMPFQQPSYSRVQSLVVQPDGRILVAGFFNTIGGTTRNHIARVNADGTLDPGFNPNPSSFVWSMAVQADGRILIGGDFTTVGGIGRNFIARFHANGTLDSGFNPNASYIVNSMAVQADGKILLGGGFSTVGGIRRNCIARLAADGTLDPDFSPNANDRVSSVAVQTDGRILLGGRFTTVGGIERNHFARVSASGTLDPGFNPSPGPGIYDGLDDNMTLRADGAVLIGGNFSTVGRSGRNGLALLLNDPATQSLTATNTSRVLWTRGGSGPEISQVSFELSTNGGTSYTPLPGTATRVGSSPNWQLTGLTLPANGHFRARGRTTGGRHNGSSGIIETVAAFSGLLSATPPSVTAISPSSGITLGGTAVTITGMGFTGATALTIGGVSATFSVVNDTTLTATTPVGLPGPASVEVATPATNAANTLYTYLLPVTVTPSTSNVIDSGPPFIITGSGFDSLTPGNNIVMFTPSGSGIVTASTPTSLTIAKLSGLTPGPLYAVVSPNALNSGAPVQVATVVPAVPGNLESLDLKIPFASDGYTSMSVTAVQPDGKVIIAGNFTSLLGVPRNNLARLNADGTLDMGFNPDPNGGVTTVAVQADGRILCGGSFSHLGVRQSYGLARIQADGTVDPTFNPNSSLSGVRVYCLAVQADGKILCGGYSDGIGQKPIVRLNADGSLDTGFSPNFASGTAAYTIAVQADGKILLGGFRGLGGTTHEYILRLAANGSLDSGFNPVLDGSVHAIIVQVDGKILLGGSFFNVNGTPRARIARVNADGTLDPSFSHNANGRVSSLAVQADGRILLGGEFVAVNGIARNYAARVNAGGTLDADFNPNPNGFVRSVTLQADGGILLAGNFSAVGGYQRNYFARLHNDLAAQQITITNASQITWTRSGSSPEVWPVTFELSTNGGADYTLLPGTPTRVGTTANWQLGGLTLPASGYLRLRGRTAEGHSSGLVESSASFGGALTAQQAWRQSFFGITTNTGNAADTFDSDNDGLANLLEYAFGLNPSLPSDNQIPLPVIAAGSVTYDFTQPAGVGGITYRAEWSPSLLPGTWTTIPDTGTAPQRRYSVPTAGRAKMFTRLVITAP
jgi:uncharacterized delta-60 repeat protein